MKNLYMLFLVLVLGTIHTIKAQDSNDSTSFLIGTWIFDYDQSVSNLTEEKKETLQNYPAEVKIAIEGAYRNRKLTFNIDGTYSQLIEDGSVTSGIWYYDASQQVLQMTNTEGLLLGVQVTENADGSLLLTPIEEGESTLLINNWHFTKL